MYFFFKQAVFVYLYSQSKYLFISIKPFFKNRSEMFCNTATGAEYIVNRVCVNMTVAPSNVCEIVSLKVRNKSTLTKNCYSSVFGIPCAFSVSKVGLEGLRLKVQRWKCLSLSLSVAASLTYVATGVGLPNLTPKSENPISRLRA